jgi:hypothetical protein
MPPIRAISAQFPRNFRAISAQFPRNFRAISAQCRPTPAGTADRLLRTL